MGNSEVQKEKEKRTYPNEDIQTMGYAMIVIVYLIFDWYDDKSNVQLHPRRLERKTPGLWACQSFPLTFWNEQRRQSGETEVRSCKRGRK